MKWNIVWAICILIAITLAQAGWMIWSYNGWSTAMQSTKPNVEHLFNEPKNCFPHMLKMHATLFLLQLDCSSRSFQDKLLYKCSDRLIRNEKKKLQIYHQSNIAANLVAAPIKMWRCASFEKLISEITVLVAFLMQSNDKWPIIEPPISIYLMTPSQNLAINVKVESSKKKNFRRSNETFREESLLPFQLIIITNLTNNYYDFS